MTRRLEAVFRARRVVLLDGDRPARTVTLSSRLQAGVAIVALTTVGWAAGAIVLVAAQKSEISSTSTTLKTTRAAYTALVEESMAQSVKIGEIVRSLSGYRSTLMAAADEGRAPADGAPARIEGATAEQEASKRLHAELADIDVKLQGVSTRNELLRSDLDRMQWKVETTERERDAARAQRLAVDGRLASFAHDLEEANTRLKETERQLAERGVALDQLQAAKDAEVARLEAARESAVTDLRVGWDNDAAHLRSGRDAALARLQAARDADIAALQASKDIALAQLAASRDATVTDLRVGHADDVAHLRAARDSAIARLTESHQRELAAVMAERDAMVRRMAAANEEAIAALQAASDEKLARLQAAREADVARVKLAADEAYAQRDVMSERLALTDQKMTAMQAAHDAAIAHLTDRTRTAINDVERVFSATGLNPRALAPQIDPRRPAGGGPFIPWSDRPAAVRASSAQAASLMSDCDQLDQLRAVLRAVPLASPLERFQVSGPFGFRHDPFNGRPSFHSGLDMLAPFDSPATTPSPGKVVLAGWDGDYGRAVEIDHGYGIHTRYAHLDKVLVRPGQEVAAGATVGLVGATGRAQAVHLHYEVTFRGVPYDPANFLKAVQNVLKKS